MANGPEQSCTHIAKKEGTWFQHFAVAICYRKLAKDELTNKKLLNHGCLVVERRKKVKKMHPFK